MIKVTDHHALLPTEQRARYEKLTTDEQRIYQMIVSRFLMLLRNPIKAAAESDRDLWFRNLCIQPQCVRSGMENDFEETSDVAWQRQYRQA